MHTRRLFPVLLAAALVLGACSSNGDDAGGSGDAGGGSVTLYSGRSEELVQPVLDDFTAATGIEVEARYGDTADLALQIVEEGDRSPAEVFLSQSPGATGYLEREGRLQELDADVVGLVEERFRSPDDRWVGVTGRVRTLVYNTDLVDPAELPSSVLELTDESHSGRVGIAPTNSSFQDFVTGMREQLGDDATLEWLEGMEANDSPTYPKNSAIVEAVARGEVEMGLVNHYYDLLQKAENPDSPTENHFFEAGDVGSVILVTAVGVLDTADDGAAAEELVAYLLSPEAQAFFAADEFEYPLALGVEAPEGLTPLDEIRAPGLDLSGLGGGLEATRELIRESGLEN